ncbi:MAG: glycosyltransferase [Clostridium sp.]|nr:glycosyltransferase [Clostridium sp.]
MTVAFISNYINHHQIPFSNACYELLGEGFHFIQTRPMEAERLQMGWSSEGERLPYVRRLYEEEERCRRLLMESDVLLAGWSDREDLVEERLNAGKLTIRVSERLYREGQWKAISPRGLVHKYREHTRYRKGPAYLLCAGAYVPSDFHLIHAYPQKMFRWGYFPETRHYSKQELMAMKGEGESQRAERTQIVWAGRFIPLKHPEYMLRLAKNLKESYKDRFHIHMAGSGELEPELKAMARNYGVEELVTFHGFMTPEAVRAVMEKSHIHIFTSNHLEGWGAVVNEAMNSGCCEVANAQVGAAPYLICHGKNGLVYPDNRYEKMEEAVRFLLDNPEKRLRMGLEAYRTITELWNGERGARELMRMIRELQTGSFEAAAEGPLSVAPVIAPKKMYDWMIRNGGTKEVGGERTAGTD